MILTTLIDQNDQIQGMAFRNVEDSVEAATHMLAVLASGLSDNEELSYPKEHNVFASPTLARDLLVRLKETALNFPTVERVDLYYPQTNTVVTGNNLHYADTTEKLERVLPWLRQLEGLKLPAFLPCGDNAYLLSDESITFVTRAQINSSDTAKVLLAVHISPELFANYIDEASGHFLLMDNKGRLLYETPDNVSYAHLVKAHWPANDCSVEVRVGRETLILTSRRYEGLGLSYYYVVPYQHFSAYNNVYMTTFLAACAAFVLLNIALIAMLSYRSNRAYRRRLNVLTDKVGIDARSVDDSFTDLAQTLDTLRQDAGQSREMRLHSAVHTLLMNPGAPQAWQTFSQEVGSGACQVLLIQTHPQQAEAHSIKELAEQWLPECRVFGAALSPDYAALAVLGRKETLKRTAALIHTELVAYCQFAYISTSSIHLLCPEALNQAYGEARNALAYRFMYPRQGLMDWELLDEEHRKPNGSHLKIFDRMMQLLKVGNYQEFKRFLGQLLDGFCIGNYTLAYCQSTLRDMAGLVYRHIQNELPGGENLFEYDIRYYFEEIPDIDAYALWMEMVVNTLIEYQQTNRAKQDKLLKDRLKNLMEENLENDVSLQMLGDLTNLRMDVLSRQFTQLFGCNYSDYIRLLKMNRAKQLLMEKTPVKDIAARLGYRSSQYFIQLFKEHSGTTPYQYYKRQVAEITAKDSEKEVE